MTIQHSDQPIISSRLQKDWYYVTQLFFIWLFWRHVRVRYAFTNRNFPKIRLTERIDIGRLREEIDHVRSLEWTDEDIEWLRSKFHAREQDGFLTDEFLTWLRHSRLSEVHIDTAPTEEGPRRLIIEPDGLWMDALDWETFILPIVTHLNALAVLEEEGLTEAEVEAIAMERLERKIEFLLANPDIKFGSFGLRRQFSMQLSERIDARLLETVPSQLLGISNVWIAKHLNAEVTGTFAHQLPISYVSMAMARGESGAALREAHMQFFDDWASVFPAKWLTAVPDTFGSQAFFEDFGRDRALHWDKFKHDSGDPVWFANQLHAWLMSLDIDPREKVLVPTDSLNTHKMRNILDATQGMFRDVGFGWGTDSSNDTGFHTYGSFVVKPYIVTLPDGRWSYAGKLSDNLDKAVGHPSVVEQLKRDFGHTVTFREECVV